MRPFGTATRRAALAGGLSVALWPFAAQGDATPTAGKPGVEPVVRGEIGRPLTLTLGNSQDAPAAFALFGLRVDPAPGFAGLDATPLTRGETRKLAFTPREPGFALYDLGNAAPGAVVISESAPPAVDLDTVVVVSGDPVTPRANGVALPLTLTAPPGARIRLRLASAMADARLQLSTLAKTQVVAIDGQPCEMFAPGAGALPLCPTARFELLFDLDPTGAEFKLNGAPALRFVPKGEPVAPRAPIAALPANPRLPRAIALERALRATLRLSAHSAPGFAKKPLFAARRGQPVALTLVNDTPMPRTLRLEGHSARILHALDDGWDPYWRDALSLDPGRTLHIAFVADNPGRWPLASPFRRAEGAAWFTVT